MHCADFRGYHRFSQLILCLFVSCVCRLVYAQPVPDTLRVTIEGIVTDSGGQPAIATVELRDSSYREVATTTSDSNALTAGAAVQLSSLSASSRLLRDWLGATFAKLVKGAKLKIVPGGPRGMCSTLKDQINAELLALFHQAERK